MKRILYVLTSPSHKRCLESFMERPDCVQMVAGPAPIITQKIVPEDYRDFKIKNIKIYKTAKELQKIVNDFRPDVYAQCSVPCAHGINLPKYCKKVYISHGMVGTHVKDIIKPASFKTSVWKGCDLYCGATNIFSEWLYAAAKIPKDKVLLNAIPQFDIVSNSKYYEPYRDKILKNSRNPDASKIILFAGFCCRDRFDFKDHNEDYFKISIELERLAKKHNWLIMIKPRQTFNKMMSFLQTKKWGKKYIYDYRRINNSKYTHFITTTGHIYRYFFADLFVVNGCSTVEVEACIVKKPLITIRTSLKRIKDYDPYRTSYFNTSSNVKSIGQIEAVISDALRKNKKDEQDHMIKSIGLAVDGQMYKRIQNRLISL